MSSKILINYPYSKNLIIDYPIGHEDFKIGSIGSDYIIEQGQLLLRQDYYLLFEYAEKNDCIIDDTDWVNNKMYGYFSYGDNKTTFRVPDKRGLSLVGFEQNYHTNIGTYIQDQIVNITGGWVGGRNANEGVWGCVYGGGGYGTYGGGNWQMAPKYFDASRVVNTGERVQTRGVTGNWVIKFR